MSTQPAAPRKKPRYLPMVLSLACAATFLMIAFRGVDMTELWRRIRAIAPFHTVSLIAIGVLGIVLRGWRWWYTLPRPHRPGEFGAAQRALAMGYAINNAVPRLGEVARVMVLKRFSKRDVASLASTVVMDRFLLDLLALSALFAFGILGFRVELQQVLGDRVIYANLLVVASIVMLIGMVLFAAAPNWFKRLLEAVGARRLGAFWDKIANLIDQLSLGMVVLKEPRRYLVILVQTVLIWGSYILVFGYALHIFGIEMRLSLMLVVYTITVLGIALPSPGGVGTFHFFARTALTTLVGVDPMLAVAFATYAHGMMFLSTTLAGVFAFLWEWILRRKTRYDEHQPMEME